MNKLELAYYGLWKRGAVADFYLKKHQWLIYSLLKLTKKDIIVLNISRRFGKSTTCATYCVEQARLNPWLTIRYATAFLTDLEDFIKPIFDDIFSTCPDEFMPEYLESKKRYVFKNGASIKLIGLDKNPNGARGNNIDILVIDEAAFVTNLEYIYKSVIVPATANRPFKVIFPSTPPEQPEHFWSRVLIPKAKLRGTYLEQTIEDNTEIDIKERERLIEEVGGKDSINAQREFYCKIVRDENIVVIPEFNKTHIVPAIKLPKHYHGILSIDLGGAVDKHGIVLCFFDFERQKFCVIGESLLAKNTATKEVVASARLLENKIKWNVNVPNRVVDMPAQMKLDLGYEDYYTRLPKKEPGSVQSNVAALRLAFTRDLIEVQADCKYMIQTLEAGCWKSGKEDFERTEDLGHLDLLAALLYAYRHINRDNPFPKHYNLNLENTYIPPEDKSAISELF